MQFGYPYPIRLSFCEIQSNPDPVLNCRIRLDRDPETGSCSTLVSTRGETESGLPESTPAGFCVFLSDPDPYTKVKILGKTGPRPESLLISGVAGVCVAISEVKTWVTNGWIDYCSRSLNRSRILKFEKLPDPDLDPDSKILEQERSWNLK